MHTILIGNGNIRTIISKSYSEQLPHYFSNSLTQRKLNANFTQTEHKLIMIDANITQSKFFDANHLINSVFGIFNLFKLFELFYVL